MWEGRTLDGVTTDNTLDPSSENLSHFWSVSIAGLEGRNMNSIDSIYFQTYPHQCTLYSTFGPPSAIEIFCTG